MIRKDQLPNVWGDNWDTEATPVDIAVGQDREPCRMVLCDTGDRSMFMLDSADGYTLSPFDENMHITIAEGATLELYRLQGITKSTPSITSLKVDMLTGSRLTLNTITLGGPHTRNNVVIRMHGEHCEVQADGLYLIDRDQQCDNYIFVEHAKPHCKSRELYKGIMDDSARARFNGHVLVQDGAIKTEAYQTNRNILLTSKAHVDTRPFLEIYNDDVKCSHGSTIGQLDEQALFYMQTRGISQRTAMTMLSYAFCDEVIRAITIDSLRDAVGDMVKKRLHGELSPSCDECAIQCTTPCNGEGANFRIDPDKL